MTFSTRPLPAAYTEVYPVLARAIEFAVLRIVVDNHAHYVAAREPVGEVLVQPGGHWHHIHLAGRRLGERVPSAESQ